MYTIECLRLTQRDTYKYYIFLLKIADKFSNEDLLKQFNVPDNANKTSVKAGEILIVAKPFVFSPSTG